MDGEDLEFILSRLNDNIPDDNLEEMKNELTEKEATEIYHELLGIFTKHNVTYRCACNISISLLYSLITGAAELYETSNQS